MTEEWLKIFSNLCMSSHIRNICLQVILQISGVSHISVVINELNCTMNLLEYFYSSLTIKNSCETIVKCWMNVFKYMQLLIECLCMLVNGNRNVIFWQQLREYCQNLLVLLKCVQRITLRPLREWLQCFHNILPNISVNSLTNVGASERMIRGTVRTFSER